MKRLFLLSALLAATATFAPAQIKTGAKAPEIKLTDFQNTAGKGLNLASLRGKVVVLDFFAYWCSPCRSATPDNNRVYAKYKSKGLVIIGIHSDDNLSEMKKTIKQWPISYPVGQDRGAKTAIAYQVQGYPTYVFIDKKGKVRFVQLGHGDTEGMVKKLLAEK